MSMIIPTGAISAAGIRLADVAEKMGSLARRADSLNSAVRSCYQGAGVGNSVGSVAAAMYNATAQTKNKSTALVNAATIYETAETELITHAQAVGRNIENGYNYAWAARPEISVILNVAPVVVEPRIHVTETKPGFFDGARNRMDGFVGAARAAVGDIKASYDNHGRVYNVVQYGKAALKGIKGLVQVAVGIGTVAGTLAATIVSGGAAAPVAGGSIPLAILEIINGCNDIGSAVADSIYVYTDCYEKVGTMNVLKEALTESGGQLGEMFGNREMGETVGKTVYLLENMVTMLDSTDKMLKTGGKIYTKVTGEASDTFLWGKSTVADLQKNEIELTSLGGLMQKLSGRKGYEKSVLVSQLIENWEDAAKSAEELGENMAELVAP